MTSNPFIRRVGMNSESMNGFSQFFLKNLINDSMTLKQPQAIKAVRH